MSCQKKWPHCYQCTHIRDWHMTNLTGPLVPTFLLLPGKGSRTLTSNTTGEFHTLAGSFLIFCLILFSSSSFFGCSACLWHYGRNPVGLLVSQMTASEWGALAFSQCLELPHIAPGSTTNVVMIPKQRKVEYSHSVPTLSGTDRSGFPEHSSAVLFLCLPVCSPVVQIRPTAE